MKRMGGLHELITGKKIKNIVLSVGGGCYLRDGAGLIIASTVDLWFKFIVDSTIAITMILEEFEKIKQSEATATSPTKPITLTGRPYEPPKIIPREEQKKLDFYTSMDFYVREIAGVIQIRDEKTKQWIYPERPKTKLYQFHTIQVQNKKGEIFNVIVRKGGEPKPEKPTIQPNLSKEGTDEEHFLDMASLQQKALVEGWKNKGYTFWSWGSPHFELRRYGEEMKKRGYDPLDYHIITVKDLAGNVWRVFYVRPTKAKLLTYQPTLTGEAALLAQRIKKPETKDKRPAKKKYVEPEPYQMQLGDSKYQTTLGVVGVLSLMYLLKKRRESQWIQR